MRQVLAAVGIASMPHRCHAVPCFVHSSGSASSFLECQTAPRPLRGLGGIDSVDGQVFQTWWEAAPLTGPEGRQLACRWLSFS